jgi:hypothetical protein
MKKRIFVKANSSNEYLMSKTFSIFYLYVENQSVPDFKGSIEGFRQTVKTKLICYGEAF